MACTSDEAEITSATSDEPQTASQSFLLTSEQFNNLNLELGTTEEQSISEAIRATGMVDVPPENIAQVSAAIPGRITRITHNVLPGKYVAKGTPLASAVSMELVQMEQDYLQAYLKNEVLSKELDRQRELLKNEAGIEKKVQEAENQWKLNKALIAGFEAKLRIANINLTKLRGGEISEVLTVPAPISGFIKTVNVHTGSSFAENDVLFEIISKEHLHVELKVFEKDAPYLKEGQKVNFNDPAFGGNATGSVFLVAKNFDEVSKTINVHVHLDKESDEAKVIPGQFLTGEIQVDERMVRVLPESALIRESEGNFVLIEKTKDAKGVEIEKVRVETGVTQHGKVEIKGPALTNKIIVKGGQRIAGMTLSEEEE